MSTLANLFEVANKLCRVKDYDVFTTISKHFKLFRVVTIKADIKTLTDVNCSMGSSGTPRQRLDNSSPPKNRRVFSLPFEKNLFR